VKVSLPDLHVGLIADVMLTCSKLLTLINVMLWRWTTHWLCRVV